MLLTAPDSVKIFINVSLLQRRVYVLGRLSAGSRDECLWLREFDLSSLWRSDICCADVTGWCSQTGKRSLTIAKDVGRSRPAPYASPHSRLDLRRVNSALGNCGSEDFRFHDLSPHLRDALGDRGASAFEMDY